MLAALLTTLVLVQSAPPLEVDDTCGGNMRQITACAAATLKLAEARLNRDHQRSLLKLTPLERRINQDAQRAWRTYRDAECRRQALENEGGSQVSLDLITCQTQLTLQRLRDLGP